jgi:membrane fusion protein, copper/silver efflux system
VQQALASDKTPPAGAAQALHDSASRLSAEGSMPETAAKLVQEVSTKSEHLHHMELAEARKNFKPISHAVITLATQVRAEGATSPFTHFYCPMVKDGGGDWLQANDQLLNPYFGSEMLRCGEKVRQFPAPAGRETPSDPHREHRAIPAKPAKKGDA